MEKISIIIVTFNSEKDVKKCLDSIEKQTYKNHETIIVDNDSKDNTIELVSGRGFLIKNKKNLGFSKANNTGIELSKGEIVLLLNADVELKKDCLDKLVKCLSEDVGFVQPKLLKPWDKKIIDSTGFILRKDRVFLDRGRDEVDKGQYDKKTDIFAGCGAALMMRKKALESVKRNDEYLDEDFFAYVEDVDLCWRMNRMGFKGKFCPDAIGYHARGHGLMKYKGNLVEFIKKRWKEKRKDKYYKTARRLAFRNNFWLLVKNEKFSGISFQMLKQWLSRIGYVVLFEPYVLLEIPRMVLKIPRMVGKR